MSFAIFSTLIGGDAGWENPMVNAIEKRQKPQMPFGMSSFCALSE
jgi:hypothetical protein